MLKECEGGVLLDIEVQANAKKTEIYKINEWRKRIIVKVKSPPVDGKANKELIKFFSNNFGKAKIIKGEKSNLKTIFIEEKKEKVLEKLRKWIDVKNL
ncbi:DUF167 domain-containing protein [Methanocaldococcus indicus]|uniref:DUF167 domain-containing protein n=1 Tax=Methanocaldococcus indicus TaxID=213231 RepID=UPI003C6D794E